jgi:hypothetical protein
MALLFVDGGDSLALQYIVNKATPQDLVLRLFTNNITPAKGDVVGGYTEASGSGYASKTLTGATWGAPTGSNPKTIAYAAQTFTFTGALGNVYGYYLTRVTGGELVYAERFSDGPYNVQHNGDTIAITPTITGN